MRAVVLPTGDNGKASFLYIVPVFFRLDEADSSLDIFRRFATCPLSRREAVEISDKSRLLSPAEAGMALAEGYR